ncbi:MAG: DUF1934 domain-containing protein [Lachnospiraceae bacterium]|nr:DUF1934 domain-containing protein [Lachnospiraceae bacterium]
MEKQEVQLLVRGTQQDISDQTIEQIYHGQYAFRQNTHYIRYAEIDENGVQSPASGSNLLKIKDRSVHLIKKGMITTRMEFDPLKKYRSSYQTPYGTFQMEIATEKLTMSQDEEGIHLDIAYQLNMDERPLSQCSLELHITFQ